MISVRVYSGGGRDGQVEEIESAAISDVVGSDDRVLWAHVTEPSDTDLNCLAEEFSLHPLAMEDIRERHQRPKLETYPTHSFLVAYTGAMEEVEMFVGPGWLVTVADSSVNLETVRSRFERTRPDPVTVGFLVYTILDDLVDGYFDATDKAEETLERIEDLIFEEAVPDEQTVQKELFDVRRQLVEFRRAVVPLRDVVASLLRREADWVDDATATHLQDVYDHVLRAVDLLDSQRELMGNAVDAHLAIISNHMNAVMKRMTSWGAILLGSTLVAGIYGMNFVHMPELEWRLGYPFALGIMLMITIGGYTYFKKRDWL